MSWVVATGRFDSSHDNCITAELAKTDLRQQGSEVVSARGRHSPKFRAINQVPLKRTLSSPVEAVLLGLYCSSSVSRIPNPQDRID